MSEITAAANKAMPAGSSACTSEPPPLVVRGGSRGTHRSTRPTPMRPSGTFTANTAGHPHAAVSQPPTGRPSAAVT